MRIQNFEDVIAWQKGKSLYVEIKKDFEQSRNYSFNDQLYRATLSITNNIAEGFDRGSDNELKQFLIIARGSCAEVRSMLHIAYADNMLKEDRYKLLLPLTIEISKILTGFIGKLATSDKRLETNR